MASLFVLHFSRDGGNRLTDFATLFLLIYDEFVVAHLQ
jgi:hypothetical protein